MLHVAEMHTAVQGDPSPGEPRLGWLWFGMFNHLAQLLRQFCQFPRFARRWVFLYNELSRQLYLPPKCPLSKEPRRIISLNIITKSIGQGIPWSEIFMDRKKSISLPFGNMTKRQGGIDKIGTFSSSSDIFSYLSSWAQSAHSQLKAVWHKTRLLVTLLYST